MSKAEKYFTEEIRKKINDAITAAEEKTSGEIRLFIEDKCKEDVLDRAAFVFKELRMDQTKERNGVLFYLAMTAKKFAIIGDAGIHAKVPEKFWETIKHEMHHHFAKGEFAPGIEKGISMAGDALHKYFPHHADDKNELSNDIVFGK